MSSVFSFLDKPDADPVARRRQHIEEIRRESFRHKLKHVANDSEQAVDYCRDLIRSGADVSEELDELICAANGLLLVAALLKREAGVSNNG